MSFVVYRQNPAFTESALASYAHCACLPCAMCTPEFGYKQWQACGAGLMACAVVASAVQKLSYLRLFVHVPCSW